MEWFTKQIHVVLWYTHSKIILVILNFAGGKYFNHQEPWAPTSSGLVTFNFFLAKNLNYTTLIFRFLLRIDRIKKRYFTKSPNRPRIARNRKKVFLLATHYRDRTTRPISLWQIYCIASHPIAKTWSYRKLLSPRVLLINFWSNLKNCAKNQQKSKLRRITSHFNTTYSLATDMFTCD